VKAAGQSGKIGSGSHEAERAADTLHGQAAQSTTHCQEKLGLKPPKTGKNKLPKASLQRQNDYLARLRVLSKGV